VQPDKITDDAAGTLNMIQEAALENSMSSYMDYMQGQQEDARHVWRLNGDYENISFSFGQRLGLAHEIGLGTAQEMFMFNSDLSEQPMMNLGEQTVYGFTRYKMSNSFGIGMGFAESSFERAAEAGSGGSHALLLQTDYSPTSWLGLQLTQTFLDESDSMLGSQSGGAFGFSSGAVSSATGAAVTFNVLPSTMLRAHYTEGFTEAEQSGLSLFRQVDPLESRSFGLSLVHQGFFGRDHDQIGISVSKPLRVYAGQAELNVPVGRTIDGDVIYKHQKIDWAPEGSQTDYDVSYRAALSDNLSLGFNLFYQDEADQDPDKWNAGLLTRMRIVY
jgi:hypothetical protein